MREIFTINGKRICSYNKAYSMCIAFYYALHVLTSVSTSLLPSSNSLSLFIRFSTYGLIFFILISLTISSRRIFNLLGLESIVSFLFLFSAISGSVSSLDWQSVYKLIATTYIPLFLAAYYITDRKMLMNYLYYVANAAVPILIAVAILSYGNWDYSYDMSLGYLMAFSVLIILAHFTIDNKLYNLILASLLSIFILFVGSRGPFICIIGFVLIELFLSRWLNVKKRLLVFFVLCTITCISILFRDDMLMVAYNLSNDLGFESRSLFLLMQGEAISHDSGREILHEYYMNLINSKPFFGHGIMGKWISDGLYPHNIVLEFILAFGYPVGLLILISLVYIIVSTLIKKNDKYSNALLILFISYNLHLLISGSYLKVWQFFVCIALCLANQNRSVY